MSRQLPGETFERSQFDYPLWNAVSAPVFILKIIIQLQVFVRASVFYT